MKNTFYYTCYLLAMGLFMVGSCEDAIDLEGPKREVPVVYGLVSSSEQVHYIRVERAFLTGGRDVPLVADEADSLYYSDIKVVMKEQGSDREIVFQRIDAEEDGLQREEGLFLQAPNILYRSTEELAEGRTYELSVSGSTLNSAATAMTTILRNTRLIRPVPGQLASFRYNAPFRVSWQEVENASFYEVEVLMTIQQEFVNGTSEKLELEWVLASNTANTQLEAGGIGFYRFLEENLKDDGVLQRDLEGLQVRITAGGEALANFREVAGANTGISGSQDPPFFTNIENGVGLFASYSTFLSPPLTLSGATRDSLENGVITGKLRF